MRAESLPVTFDQKKKVVEFATRALRSGSTHTEDDVREYFQSPHFSFTPDQTEALIEHWYEYPGNLRSRK